MTPQDAIDRADEIGAEIRHRHQLAREARTAGVEHGRQAAITDPELGRGVGFDVGFGARQDAWGFVFAVLAGYQAGCQARKELAAQLLEADAG